MPLKSREIHILLGCADSRDLGQTHLDAVTATIADWAARGIEVELHVIRAAGSFVTQDVVADIKGTFEGAQREQPDGVPLAFFVHITTHGELKPESDSSYAGHIHRMAVVEGSPLNCGMMNASRVGVQLEQLLLEHRPEVCWAKQRFRVEDEVGIRTLLREVYAHDGFLAGDWVRGIDLLRAHPRTQRAALERAIAADPELRALAICITAGLQDYALHALVRVDGGDPPAPFWDEVQARIRVAHAAMGPAAQALTAQADRQQPLAGLISLTDPRRSSRTDAARHYKRLKGLPPDQVYLPNTVFNIAGRGFDVPGTPFGPYVIAGFYYGVRHLGLRDQMVLGYDAAQTARIMAKLRNDPLMRLIIETHDVNLIPLNQVDLGRA